MCLHINLTYDRTKTLENPDNGEEIKINIYKCIICKKEFEIIERD